jgi:thiosulfate/3-mercaptopyruvate sulfurtransferase
MMAFGNLHRWLLLLPLLAGGFAANAAAPDTKARFLVTPQWLEQHRVDPDLRILDLRAERDYRAGHVDGAVNLPVDRLFINDDGRRYIGRLGQIQSALSAAGIDGEVQVILYDGGEFLSSARAFWVFEVYGHLRVAALDGGFKAWTRLNLPTATNKTLPPTRKFVPAVAADRLATKLSTRLAIDNPGTTIIDARDAPDYRGEKSVAQRFGHIPSAVNIPILDHFDHSDGIKRLKSDAQIAPTYRDIDPNQKVVTYCNTGVMSATTYFVLRRLGYDVANYDGSWIEWGNDTALPIVDSAPGTPRVQAAPGR